MQCRYCDKCGERVSVYDTHDCPPFLMPLEKPIVMDAIRCRLRQDIEMSHHLSASVEVPKNELRWIVDILDAARACVREWQPNATEKARGAGTGVGMRAAEDRLIQLVRRDLSPDA